MEKMDPKSHEWGYIGRKFFAQKMWAPLQLLPSSWLCNLRTDPYVRASMLKNSGDRSDSCLGIRTRFGCIWRFPRVLRSIFKNIAVIVHFTLPENPIQEG